MKRFLFSSFRNRLFAAFLAASLIPLFICSALLLQIFRLQMTSQAQQEASDSLAELAQILDQVHLDFTRIAAAVSQDDTLILRGVVVPNTGGRRGLEVAAAVGTVAARAEAQLECIAHVTEQDMEAVEADALPDLQINQEELEEMVYVLYNTGKKFKPIYIANKHENILIKSLEVFLPGFFLILKT